MNSPSLQYVASRDGVRIAFAECGAGVPLVLLPQPFNHLQLFWRSKTHRQFFEDLGARFRLVQYDGRGMGMSDRDLPPEMTMTDHELDLEAVLDHLDLERVLLFAPNASAHIAIRFAVAQPERVYGLMLWQALPHNRGTDAGFMAKVSAEDWERALVMSAQVFLPGEDLETAVNVMRVTVTQEDSIKLALAAAMSSVEDVLEKLRVPVMLIYKTMAYRRTEEWARLMATSIPGARLVALDDDGDLFGYPRDSRRLMAAIDGFVSSLGLSPAPPIVSPETPAPAASRDSAGLTMRERELLTLLAAGRKNREIAADLVISERTVARHITNIYTKIGARGKAEATAYAIRSGIV